MMKSINLIFISAFSLLCVLFIFACENNAIRNSKQAKKFIDEKDNNPDTPPCYVGCENIKNLNDKYKCNIRKEKQHIAKFFEYPEEVKNNGLEGSIEVILTVSSSGSIEYIIISNVFDEECGKIAKRIADNFPKMVPAKKNGISVESEYNFTVPFRLPKEEKFIVRSMVLNSTDFSYGSSMEEPPIFGDCTNMKSKTEKEECSARNIYSFLQEHLDLPETPYRTKYFSEIQFIVRKDGSLFNINGGSFLGPAMSEAIYKMPKWNPGMANGKPVNVSFAISYPYLIEDLKRLKPNFSKLEKLKGFHKNEKPINVRTRNPCFIGCEDLKSKAEIYECSKQKFISYFKENLIYPEEAKSKNIIGTVELMCKVDTEGIIREIRIIKDIGAGCGKAAKDAVSKIDKLSPLLHAGRPVFARRYIIKVDFK